MRLLKNKFTVTVLISASLLYPFLIFFGLQIFSPRIISIFIAVIILIRLIFIKDNNIKWKLIFPLLIIISIAIITLFVNKPKILLFIPLVINYGFFLTFISSIYSSPSMVEIFARMQLKTLKSTNELSPAEIIYCKKVTWLWSIFFFFNGLIIIYISLFSTIKLWSLYTGLISYLIMGSIFAVEIPYRYWRFRRYDGFLVDFIFIKIFPPQNKL